jgi:hypothetical protein
MDYSNWYDAFVAGPRDRAISKANAETVSVDTTDTD